MEFVIDEPEADESIHVEASDHGRVAKISSTSLLLNVGGICGRARNRESGSRVNHNFDSVSTLQPGCQYNSPVL